MRREIADLAFFRDILELHEILWLAARAQAQWDDQPIHS